MRTAALLVVSLALVPAARAGEKPSLNPNQPYTVRKSDPVTYEILPSASG